MQCFSIAGLISILWLIYGYSLAFGPDVGGFIGGLNNLFLSGIGLETLKGDIPESVFSMFQLTFAIITPGLIIGSFAERVKFSSMLLFSGVWFTLVYLPVTHWVWGGGWLGQLGLLDFAGGTVVHVTAGVAALVCALVISSRRGFPETAMAPHNMTLTVTGAGMLWVGWYGFNAGSALAANGSAGMALLATHMSAAAGAMTWMVLKWSRYGKPSVLGVVTGMVAGLGTITPASGSVGPGGALVIGIIAGIVCFTATLKVKRVFKIDDSLDVFPVHGVGGVLGTLAAGVFASKSLGIFSGNGFAQGIDSMGRQLGVRKPGSGGHRCVHSRAHLRHSQGRRRDGGTPGAGGAGGPGTRHRASRGARVRPVTDFPAFSSGWLQRRAPRGAPVFVPVFGGSLTRRGAPSPGSGSPWDPASV